MLKRPADDMSKAKVNVKWGKEAFSDVEVDLTQPPLVFKSQLFTLTNVPPDRQKVMVKGALVKDDEWGKAALNMKDGATVMLMGSADAVVVAPPANVPTFVEDLPESEQETLATKAYGSGLQNLGNTCYMNSSLQCLYAVEPLRKALLEWKPAPAADGTSKLAVETRDLFKDMSSGGEAFPPFRFLLNMRNQYPQFAQQGNDGSYMQQDAEECYSGLMFTLRERLKDADGKSVVDDLFSLKMRLRLECEESGEKQEETSTTYMLKCNISSDVNHLHQGILLALKDDREKRSEKLDRTVLFKGVSAIVRLPPYLTLQMMRFYYRTDTQNKAKILRKVSFQPELDCYDFCSEELKKELDGPRAAYKAYQDRLIEERKRVGGKDKDKASTSQPAAASTASAAPAAGGGDAEMTDAGAAVASTSGSFAGANTGRYELFGVLTHKGRSADSGHYTAWVRQKDGKWVLFDDDKLIIKDADEILNLNGGGDWHMGYLLLYRSITVPADA